MVPIFLHLMTENAAFRFGYVTNMTTDCQLRHCPPKSQYKQAHFIILADSVEL